MMTDTSTEHTGFGNASNTVPTQRPLEVSCEVLGCHCLRLQVWDSQVLPNCAQHAKCLHSAGVFHQHCWP